MVKRVNFKQRVPEHLVIMAGFLFHYNLCAPLAVLSAYRQECPYTGQLHRHNGRKIYRHSCTSIKSQTVHRVLRGKQAERKTELSDAIKYTDMTETQKSQINYIEIFC